MTNIPLATSITLVYRDDVAGQGPGFEVLGGPGGAIAFDPSTESAGKTITLEDYGNASFTFSGVPQDGDSFVIANNTSGSGDNRNALRLASAPDGWQPAEWYRELSRRLYRNDWRRWYSSAASGRLRYPPKRHCEIKQSSP